MFAALYLATQPRASHGFEVFGRRGLLQPSEDFQRLCIMAERKERYDGVAIPVFKQVVKGFRIPALLQQVYTPHVSCIDLAGVNSVADHLPASQVVTQCHGPKPRIDAFFKIAIIRRVSFADHLLPSVRVFFGGD